MAVRTHKVALVEFIGGSFPIPALDKSYRELLTRPIAVMEVIANRWPLHSASVTLASLIIYSLQLEFRLALQAFSSAAFYAIRRWPAIRPPVEFKQRLG
jgi:hypothetical protein